MRVVFAASECVPFAKTGGLADVVGALPAALSELGHEVTVYLPHYRETRLPDTRVAVRSITIPFADRYRFCTVLDGGKHLGVQFYFIDCPEFFDRPGLYGDGGGDFPDNAQRFCLFSRGVLEAAKILGVPEVFHCHDWQTALLPVLLRSVYADDPMFRDVRCVFTIHNMGYQGVFGPHTLTTLLLPPWLLNSRGMEFFGGVNFLKGGLVFADIITTVSRKYSQEIQTEEYGFGLSGVLRDRQATVTGILNGVDYTEWNPQGDKYTAAKFSPQDLAGKRACKADLLRQFGAKNPPLDIPVIGIVSRFAAQKGFDLMGGMAEELAAENMIMVVLGSGDRGYEDLFWRLTQLFPDKFALRIAHDEGLAHKVEAGADMFLMPSRYEPCGLNQIYSLKYGTVPIVRATGGLDDTIENWEPHTEKGTGFKFWEYTSAALLATIRWALTTYEYRDSWEKLMRNGMHKDFSWRSSAREYARVYERAQQSRG